MAVIQCMYCPNFIPEEYDVDRDGITEENIEELKKIHTLDCEWLTLRLKEREQK